MAAVVKIIEEQDVSEGPQAPPPASAAQMASYVDPQVVAAIQNINGRLQVAEATIQAVPKAIGLIGTLSRALGARALMFVSLLGCLGLAGAAALQPSWQGLGIFGAFAVLVYLPQAYLASRGN